MVVDGPLVTYEGLVAPIGEEDALEGVQSVAVGWRKDLRVKVSESVSQSIWRADAIRR